MAIKLSRKWRVYENLADARAGARGAGVTCPELDALEKIIGTNRLMELALAAQRKDGKMFVGILLRDSRVRRLAAIRKFAEWSVRQ